MRPYIPKPIDTSAIRLTDAQQALVEALAENVHDVWAEKRLQEGWRFGATRDDGARTHPCLVPYKDLPDSEKAYDRVLVEQVIKAAAALGFRIDRP